MFVVTMAVVLCGQPCAYPPRHQALSTAGSVTYGEMAVHVWCALTYEMDMHKAARALEGPRHRLDHQSVVIHARV